MLIPTLKYFLLGKKSYTLQIRISKFLHVVSSLVKDESLAKNWQRHLVYPRT